MRTCFFCGKAEVWSSAAFWRDMPDSISKRLQPLFIAENGGFCGFPCYGRWRDALDDPGDLPTLAEVQDAARKVFRAAISQMVP